MAMKTLLPILTACVLLMSAARTGSRPASGEAGPTTHELKATPKTVTWGYYDAKAKPVLRIKSGDVVQVHTLITNSPAGLEGAFLPAREVEQALRDVFREVKDKGPGGHILTGPIYVEGAEPGNTLEVRIKKIKLAIPYGYNAFAPKRGFLPEDFPRFRTKLIRLDDKRMIGHFAKGIELPLRPFSEAWGWHHHPKPAASAAGLPAYTPATSTTRSWSRARPCSSPSTCAAPCSPSAMGTPPRATGKSTSRHWRRRSMERFSSLSART
jgi:hypothetical protein